MVLKFKAEERYGEGFFEDILRSGLHTVPKFCKPSQSKLYVGWIHNLDSYACHIWRQTEQAFNEDLNTDKLLKFRQINFTISTLTPDIRFLLSVVELLVTSRLFYYCTFGPPSYAISS